MVHHKLIVQTATVKYFKDFIIFTLKCILNRVNLKCLSHRGIYKAPTKKHLIKLEKYNTSISLTISLLANTGNIKITIVQKKHFKYKSECKTQTAFHFICII